MGGGGGGGEQQASCLVGKQAVEFPQVLTGIYIIAVLSGAVFCDATLRLGGFDGEGLQTSSVLVVKTHSAVPAWRVVEKERHFKKEKVGNGYLLYAWLVNFCKRLNLCSKYLQGGESNARLGGRELTLLCGFNQYTLR